MLGVDPQIDGRVSGWGESDCRGSLSEEVGVDGEHDQYGHGDASFQEVIRIPLIVKWPGVTKPGSVNTDLVQNLDYGETFLEIAGAMVPSDMQGRSLVPAISRRTGSRTTRW